MFSVFNYSKPLLSSFVEENSYSSELDGLDLVDPIHFLTSSYFIDLHHAHVLDVIHCKIENTSSEREVPEYFWLTLGEVLNHENIPVWLKHYVSFLNEPATHRVP